MRSTVLLLALLGGLATATSLFVLSNRTMFGFAFSLTPQISGASAASTSKSGDAPKSFQQARQQQFESWTITCQAVADRCRMVQQLAHLSSEGEPQRFILVALQVGPGGIVEATIVVEGTLTVPFGFFIPFGGELLSDDQIVSTAQYRTCLPTSCVLMQRLTRSDLQRLGSQREVSLILVEAASSEPLFQAIPWRPQNA